MTKHDIAKKLLLVGSLFLQIRTQHSSSAVVDGMCHEGFGLVKDILDTMPDEIVAEAEKEKADATG